MPLAAKTRSDDIEWTTVIAPHAGAFDWKFAELWRCRDLISLFVWRDFVSLYKQTILGPAWHIVQPLITTLTYTIIFGHIARLPTNGCPPFLFYMAGNVLWNFFSGCLGKTANTFVGNAGLLGKVYFHRLAIPIAAIFSTLISFAIQFALFLGFWIFYLLIGAQIRPTAFILALPLVLLMLAGFSLGAGIIISSLTTRYRDLAFLIGFGTQLLMFLTPVIYPVSAIPEKHRWLTALNPLSPLFELFRAGFLGSGDFTLLQLAASFLVMLALLFVGLMLFSRVERTFMDTV
jgi:lipopolysaccharide transport system permease protein